MSAERFEHEWGPVLGTGYVRCRACQLKGGTPSDKDECPVRLRQTLEAAEAQRDAARREAIEEFTALIATSEGDMDFLRFKLKALQP